MYTERGAGKNHVPRQATQAVQKARKGIRSQEEQDQAAIQKISSKQFQVK